MGKKNHRKNTGRGKRSAGRRGNQRAAGTYSYTPYVGPTRAARIPAEFSVRLVNTDYDTFTAASSYALRRFGIVEFLGYRPLYCLELYQIWKYCRVTAITLELKVVNTSATVPMIVAIGMSPYSDSGALTPDRSWETPGTARRLLSVQGGMDRCSFKKTFVAQNCYGQPYLDQKYWIDVSQSASATPVDANEPIAYYMLSDTTGVGGFSCKLDWKITYHMQFFDLRIPSSSLALSTELQNESQHPEQFEIQADFQLVHEHSSKKLSENSLGNSSQRNGDVKPGLMMGCGNLPSLSMPKLLRR